MKCKIWIAYLTRGVSFSGPCSNFLGPCSNFWDFGNLSCQKGWSPASTRVAAVYSEVLEYVVVGCSNTIIVEKTFLPHHMQFYAFLHTTSQPDLPPCWSNLACGCFYRKKVTTTTSAFKINDLRSPKLTPRS